MPRPTKLDEENKARLIHLVLGGATVEEAAAVIGCSRRTVEREAHRDEPFGWRLNLARDSRDAAHQAERAEHDVFPHDGEETQDVGHEAITPEQLAGELRAELEALWAGDQQARDKTQAAPAK